MNGMIVSQRRVTRAVPKHCQSGVGLIEVLVAVLLLSIAFLGIAALQGRSLSTNNSAMARSLATIASYSILDAMRVDIEGARAGSYDRIGSSKIIASACPDASGTMAETQLGLWCEQLGQGLGAVETTTGQVACADTSGTADCTITITFDDSRAGVGGSRVQTIATRAML